MKSNRNNAPADRFGRLGGGKRCAGVDASGSSALRGSLSRALGEVAVATGAERALVASFWGPHRPIGAQAAEVFLLLPRRAFRFEQSPSGFADRTDTATNRQQEDD